MRGLANVDITSGGRGAPRAWRTAPSLKKGSVVTTSRDTSRVARALKRAIIARPQPRAACNVEDLELATVPLTRFQVRNQQRAGRHHRAARARRPRHASRSASSTTTARDIDEATQRKIERLLYREDFRRAFAGDIGDIVFPPRALEFYTAALEASVDAERLRDRAFKVVLDYSFGAASIVMPSVLAKIGADVLAVNPFAATRRRAAVDDRERAGRRASASSCGRRAATSACVIDPDGETATIIDDAGHALDADQALLALRRAGRRGATRARASRCRSSVSREAERIVERARRRDRAGRSCRPRT